jgi:hypothetical protein
LWGSVTYIITEWIKNGQGDGKNIVLQGWRLYASFFVVSGWFYFILSEAEIFHSLTPFTYDYSVKLVKEIFNLASTIICSILLLGIGIKKK